MHQISKENNFNYLFIGLITLLFSTALMKQVQALWLDDLIELIILAMFLLGVHSHKSDKSWMWAVHFMAFVLVAVFMVNKLFVNTSLTIYFHLFILFTFFTGSFILSFKQILLSQKINQNMIIGSLVLYLLLGLMWTIIYLFILNIYPESFNGLEAVKWQENFSRVAYYSFVTLTTLGYGDISPKNPLSEFFVFTEAIAGVFYMAIIVSSLVGARMSSITEVKK